MNKHVVTLNVNNWASPNAIASQRAAAERWGAEYHEFTKPWCIGTDPADVFAAKFDLHLLPFKLPCRVVWLDADVMVRIDCPSLFELVPVGTFGGVLNNQDGSDLQYQVARDWWKKVNGDVAFDGDGYINGGVLVFDLPAHAEVFYLSKILRHVGPVNPMYEQTLLNTWLRIYPRLILPHTFNRLGKEAWLSGPAMTSYVYHLANLGELCGDKRQRLGAIEWRGYKLSLIHI